MGDAQNVQMTAKIQALGERLEVDVLESQYTSGIHWVLYNDGTTVTDESGASLSVSDLRVGDKIKIVYSGQVMMSYPPQIVALKITRLP